MHNHFSVGLRLENMTFVHQEKAQLLVVVDFSVEYDPYRIAFVRERLMTARQIDNGEPCVTQSYPGRKINSLVVGPAMPDRIQHAPNQAATDTRILLKSEFSANPTHNR